jgi:hypothetical protein
MDINIVGIDPSLISTAVCINGKLFNYCRESDAYGKTGLKKWFKMCESEITLSFVEYREYDNYSDGEITKLKDYDKITDKIISDIIENIDLSKPTRVGIEGFSYASNAGAIIDLVTFSTLLRKKIFDKISEDIHVISPTTLKLESCKLTYPPINVGKRVPKLKCMNNEGISGGNFTKREIFLSIVENDKLVDEWSLHCKSIKDDLLESSKIPKPYEDINDAVCIFLYIKEKYINDQN